MIQAVWPVWTPAEFNNLLLKMAIAEKENVPLGEKKKKKIRKKRMSEHSIFNRVPQAVPPLNTRGAFLPGVYCNVAQTF